MTKKRKRTILYSREAPLPEAVRQVFTEAGVAIREIPMNRTVAIETVPLKEPYDWIFFTSVNGVKYFDLSQLDQKAKILAIGNQTNKMLQKLGYHVDFQPKHAYAESLVSEWLAQVPPGQRVYWPHSILARRVIYDTLVAAGHVVLEQDTYKNEFLATDRKELEQLLATEDLDYALFASPSAWHSFYEVAEDQPESFWQRLKIASIGPVTTKIIEKDGKKVAIQPEVYDMPHLYAALSAEFQK